MVSLSQLREVPVRKIVLLVGPPGVGKSAFCEQAVLQSLTMDKPVIYLATDRDSSEVRNTLTERGLSEIEPGLLSFIDAYNETVGLAVSDQPDTVRADCSNLSSISIAISKLQERMGKKGVLLVFDSLVSPYLLNGSEVMKFLRLTLARFVAEGNSVLASMDEGCSKKEDLGAMMSLSNGVVRIETKDDNQLLNVVKHPEIKPTTISVPTDKIWQKKIYNMKLLDQEKYQRFTKAVQNVTTFRREMAEFAVNGFWPKLASWSSLLWNPSVFPEMIYESWVEFASYIREIVPMLPWRMKLVFKLFMPKKFSNAKDMRKLVKMINGIWMEQRRWGIMEYLEDDSRIDEHYIRVHEYIECNGLENVGVTTSSIFAPLIAGFCKGLEKEEREWNAIETKCVGLGDPYCEFKIIPYEFSGLKDSLKKDSSAIVTIHERLMQSFMDFLMNNKSLIERPKLGSDFYMFQEMSLPAMASERYRISLRMGGTKSGKEIAGRLLDAGVEPNEAEKRILDFLKYCKVGKVERGETIKIKQNCESLWTRWYDTTWEEPLCFFTTGFLNGFFSAVKNQHVKETKCIAMGDPYCEWEFR
jgi:predicted hydrocarbon binding protein/KaiC/GvpD/RAD55 family RecA-like ATPase